MIVSRIIMQNLPEDQTPRDLDATANNVFQDLESVGRGMELKDIFSALDPEAVIPEVLRVAIPITRKQALFILKKKLHIRKIYYIISCNEI